jgi:site-specific recombinase XerD
MTAISKVVSDCIASRRASRYSENTISDYQVTYNNLLDFLEGDPDINEIDDMDIANFLASQKQLSDKSVLNYHIGLSSLWSWALERDLVDEHVVRLVKPPKPTEKEIIPLTRQEILRLLEAARAGEFEIRDQSVVFLLLDTGIRASELSNLKIKDFDWETRHVLIDGKGKKERLLKFSERTKNMLIRYLRGRGVTNLSRDRNQAVFISKQSNPFSRDTLYQLIGRLRDRAGIPRCHPHLFRHTFAIEFLRNGGDIYTLQKFLGHATLDMVKRYLQIAQTDIDRVHEKASPIKGWELCGAVV